jgi:heptosyltransferase-2
MNNILVRVPNWLGDCVMALPCLSLLRKSFPHAKIIVACRQHLSSCFDADLSVDETIICPVGGASGIIALWRNASALRVRGFDAGLLFTNSFSTAFWLWRAGARERHGFDRDGRGFFLTHPIPLSDEMKAAHMIDYYNRVAQSMGADIGEAKTPPPVLRIPDSGREEAAALRARLGLKEKQYAVFAPVSAYGEVKDWPAACYANLAEVIHRESGMPVLLTATKEQRGMCERIVANSAGCAVNVAGDTGLSGFMGLTEGAAVFVGGDSGGAHVAAALDVPTVAIYGVTEPGRTRQVGRIVKIVGAGGVQTPDLKSASVREQAKQALANITVDTVWDEVQALLARGSGKNE